MDDVKELEKMAPDERQEKFELEKMRLEAAAVAAIRTEVHAGLGPPGADDAGPIVLDPFVDAAAWLGFADAGLARAFVAVAGVDTLVYDLPAKSSDEA